MRKPAKGKFRLFRITEDISKLRLDKVKMEDVLKPPTPPGSQEFLKGSRLNVLVFRFKANQRS